ncbi:Alpha/beta hydrolase fold-1 [Truncatella angustata]|uniref:Alpha/beta hydrolase fold-1 n=1 Tax=Truncatella angustata TaxID=152316 RepID=A0A9P8ZZE7_9PEZI|nr:Alpha/beta hydrolase fold-1 [Truncatella angustata]KAH6654985.1 Alpha/beta hydrolase fold-1 [Truncatella angustata]KAH8204077.1 hypothetical protein TruAng_001759 [Truncatella angustata]
MPGAKPVLVFLPGGWHTPEVFAPTSTLLEKEGYTIQGVSFPTIGTELRNVQPQQSWDEDVQAVRDVLSKYSSEGRDIVLITHSYSGTVGSEACKGFARADREGHGLAGGVVKLVYLAGFILDVGTYCWEQSGGKPINPKTTIIKGDLCYAERELAKQWFYNECTPEQQQDLVSRLQSQAWKAFMSRTTYAAWRDIPGVYLITENDHAISVPWQEAMLEGAKGHRFEVVKCDADHTPFVSRPAMTARVIRRAAGELIEDN